MLKKVYMCLVLPKLMPLWVAPLFEPYWREMTPCPARSCSSEKFLTFFSDSLGPVEGLPKLPAWKNQHIAISLSLSVLFNMMHLIIILYSYDYNLRTYFHWHGPYCTLQFISRGILFYTGEDIWTIYIYMYISM